MEEELVNLRLSKAIDLAKKHASIIMYALLALLVYIVVKIRTSNLPGLKDVSTGDWTLGPDLDPFLFLRWAKEIVANGSLSAVDTMRYVPVGFNTSRELLLHPYLIVLFHKLLSFFGLSSSVTYSAVIYPAVIFGATVIVFFFFVREIFIKSHGRKVAELIALISAFFFSVIPSLLPRTIAGIPEKEASGFFFLFIAFYAFLVAWRTESWKKRLIFTLLTVFSTTSMALVWGGYVYIFVTLGLAVLLAYFTGQLTIERKIVYAIWILGSALTMWPFSGRYSPIILLSSTTTGAAFLVLGVLIIDELLSLEKTKVYLSRFPSLAKIPQPILALLATILIGFLLFIVFFGPTELMNKISDLKNDMVTPIADRLGVTVAENRQPFFDEWAGNFGPTIRNIPLFFWLFFIGSIYLFWSLLSSFTKLERFSLTSAYTFFLFAIVFSRYKSTSILNGTNNLSLLLYALGFIVFIYVAGKIYLAHFKESNKESFGSLDSGLLILFALFFFSIVSARGAVRLIMILGIPSSIIASFFVVHVTRRALLLKKNAASIFLWVCAILLILSTAYSAQQFYIATKGMATSYVPSTYTQQWQNSMSWVRTNTSENAVFAHWWDYGYWVQSIGERATVLDGGNAISYWNHLMGRLALTGSDTKEALSFFYTHNVTHFLIDSTDIGKYPAFSSIGSDANYDRTSSLQTFLKDTNQVQEVKNGTMFVYTGAAVGVDDDIIFEDNGTRVFIPRGNSAVIATIVRLDSLGRLTGQPEGVFFYKNQQIRLPLRYGFDGTFRDFGSGVESGVFIYPAIVQQNNQLAVDKTGAIMYLSSRVVKSHLAQFYLYGLETSNFNLAHSEDDVAVKQLKQQGQSTSDFVYYQGFRGPIKIWEVSYPRDVAWNASYLVKEFPDQKLAIA